MMRAVLVPGVAPFWSSVRSSPPFMKIVPELVGMWAPAFVQALVVRRISMTELEST